MRERRSDRCHARARDTTIIAMIACAALAATGAEIAWLTIGADALEAEPKRRGRPPEPVPADFACSVAGPPLRSATRQAFTGRA
jgi:hypothetical protein